MTVELNGTKIEREDVRDWLLNKRVTLWSDWCITDPRRMETAIDWFMGEMSALSASKGTGAVESSTKGKKKASAKRATART